MLKSNPNYVKQIEEIVETTVEILTLVTESYINSSPLPNRTTMMYKQLAIMDSYIKEPFTDYKSASEKKA